MDHNWWLYFFTWAHCVELHDAESEHCESEFEFEFCDRYDNPESTPLSMWGVLESFFPLESDFIEPPPSLTTFEFITLNEKVTKRFKMVENLNLWQGRGFIWRSFDGQIIPTLEGNNDGAILDSKSKRGQALDQISFYNGIIFWMRTLCKSLISN